MSQPLEYASRRMPAPTPGLVTRIVEWLVLCIAGVLLPLTCFFISTAYVCPLKPEYQSGGVKAYAGLLLDGQSAWPTLILDGYSIVCFTLVLIRLRYFSGSVVVRAGVYGGVILAGVYTLIMWLALIEINDPLGFEYLLLSAGAALLILYVNGTTAGIFWWARRRDQRVLWALLAVPLAPLLLSCWYAGSISFSMVLLIFGPLGYAPAAALGAYGVMAVRVRRVSGARNGADLIATSIWAAALGIEGVATMTAVIDAYGNLPASPPEGCYIATAAACGHRRLVGSRVVQVSGGQIMMVNLQLQRLKAAELILKVGVPRVHRMLRAGYDLVGPPLALRIRSPWVADVAYVMLKPAEWVAAAVLCVGGRMAFSAASRLYTQGEEGGDGKGSDSTGVTLPG